MNSEFQIVNIRTLPKYTDAVISLGDKNSSTLGFLPAGAFDECAQRGLIYIAIKGGVLAGYLLYREVKRNNQFAIVHLCVEPEYRGSGLATNLIDEIKTIAKGSNGIFLWCRKDYEAVRVWETNRFTVMAEKKGRSKTGSILEMWVYKDESNTRQRDLWSTVETGVPAVLDANSFFDLSSNKQESKETQALLSDWVQDIELYVTKELFNEIRRSDNKKVRESSRQYAHTFSTLPAKEEEQKEIRSQLDSLLSESDSINFSSDKEQVAWAISGNADYFITRDNQLLRHSTEIRDLYGLEIIRPAQLIIKLDAALEEESYRPSILFNSEIRTRKINENDFGILFDHFRCNESGERKGEFISRLSNQASDIANNNLCLVEVNGRPSVFYACSPNDSGVQRIHFLRSTREIISRNVVEKILSLLIRDAVSQKVKLTIIRDAFYNDNIKEILEDLGFVHLNSGFIKLHIQGTTNSLDNPIEHSIPEIRTASDAIYRKFENRSLFEIETAYWPLKILTNEIENFIVAIEPYWAKELFDEEYASMDLFGSDPNLIFNHRNAYYRSGTRSGIENGSRILWYVKDKKKYPNSGTIRAVSLLDSFEIGKPKDIFKKYRSFGVYKWPDIYSMIKSDIEKNIMAFQFHSTEMLKTPVGFHEANKFIRDNGGSSNNFQSPLKICDKTFAQIYSCNTDL